MVAHSSFTPERPRLNKKSHRSHRRGQHVPRHMLEEHRVARATAAGAAGAVVIGAAFGLTGGNVGKDDPVATSPTGNTVDALYEDRGEQVGSRGLARATLPAQVTRPPLPRAQLPQVQEAEPEAEGEGITTPLPPIPDSCEEYSGNRAIGCALLLDAGFDISEMPALDTLWNRESGWNHEAYNESSGAYGIPQALPGNKMASHGDDWETNPATQIAWGLDYIADRYGTPSAALAHSDANGWY